jgi:RNA 2',3'-cyclic 3'-phosphodiesterase
MRRIFLAINLPESIKRELLRIQSQWAGLPIRWTKRDNLHVTLIFLGYLSDEEVLEVCRLIRQTVQESHPFEIKLRRICLSPEKFPRLIWAEGEKNPDLIKVRNDLEGKLLSYQGGKSFQVHVTLARIRRGEWQNLPDQPEIDKNISLVFPVNSIEVMESFLSKKGPDYTILESIELGG